MASLRRPATYVARRLRQEMTLPEVMLWQRLRGGQAGAKFRRQHSIGNFIVDFYCRDAALVIEIDGIAHDMGDRPERDVERDRVLAGEGYKVLRIAASEVLRDVDAVAESIRLTVLERMALRDDESPLRPLRGHLPASGEDWV